VVEATSQDTTPLAALGGHLAVLALAPLPLVFALFAATPGTREQATLLDCERAPRPIELHAEPDGAVYALCISPGLATSVLFDTPLPPGAVVVAPGQQDVQVAQAERFITLLPAPDVIPGEQLKVTVRFGDGAAPATVTFLLWVHPARAERQVEVVRHRRTVESYQQELKAREEELQRCLAENARHGAAQGKLEGLTALLSAGFLGKKGISSRYLWDTPTRPGSALQHRDAWSYRSIARVAVELLLDTHTGAKPWVAEGAALVGAGGRELRGVRVWQSGPVEPGGSEARVIVEADATEGEAQGTWTLKLWDASGKRTVILDGVVFPPLSGVTAP
jgi:uncharacterized protein (TIGR02268 family)